jgi:hypothetical protein
MSAVELVKRSGSLEVKAEAQDRDGPRSGHSRDFSRADNRCLTRYRAKCGWGNTLRANPGCVRGEVRVDMASPRDKKASTFVP